MRGLWVEDFDETLNESKINILKDKWLEQLGLFDVKLEITKTLASSLTYINEKSNNIDFVILDINFPLFDAIKDKENIKDGDNINSDYVYKEFFSGHIIEDYYKSKSDNGAGTGILAYRYLTEVVRFPKDKIAFFSANVITSNAKYPAEIQDILKNDNLGDAIEDLEDYINNENIHISFDPDSFHNIKDLKNWIGDNISPINENSNENSNVNIESTRIFTEAEKALEAVGTKIEHAYIKGDSCCEFYNNFYQNNNTDYVQLRYYIQEMSLILNKYLVNQKVDIDILTTNVHNLDKMCKNMYDKAYYSNVVNSVLKIPLNEKGFANSENKNNKNIVKILKNELINLIHSLEGFEQQNINDFNRFATLKLTRNWLSHSICSDKSFSIHVFAFIFMQVYHFYFDIDKLKIEDKIEYENYEKKLIDLTERLQPKSVKLDEIISKFYKENNFNSKKDIYTFYSDMGKRKKSRSFDKINYENLIKFYNLLNYCDTINK